MRNHTGASSRAQLHPGHRRGHQRSRPHAPLAQPHHRKQLFGLTLIDYCIGAPQDCADPTLAIDPYPDGNRVVGNRFVSNQANVIFIPGTGKDYCFERNRPTPLAPDVVLPSCR